MYKIKLRYLFLISVSLIFLGCSSSLEIVSKRVQASSKSLNRVYIAHNLTKKSIAITFQKSFTKSNLTALDKDYDTINLDSIKVDAQKKDLNYIMIFEDSGEIKKTGYSYNSSYNPYCSQKSIFGEYECSNSTVEVKLYKVTDPLIYWSANITYGLEKGKQIMKTLVKQLKEDEILEGNFKTY